MVQYVTPVTLELPEGIYNIAMPSNHIVNNSVYNFKQWNDGSTNPTKTVNLTGDMAVSALYELQVLPRGHIDVHAFMDQNVINASYEIEGVKTGVTPELVEVDPGTYIIHCTWEGETKTETVTVGDGQTIRVDFKFVTTPIPPLPPLLPRIRAFLEGYPVFGRIYETVDQIRLKRQEVKLI